VIYGGACSLDGFMAGPIRRDRLAALQQGLELKECRTLEGGCVFVTYQMRH
jgi:hypothetical protein